MHQKTQWFDSDKKYTQSGKYWSYFAVPMIFDGTNVTMNGSDDIWSWVHQNCIMILIRQKLHSIKKKALTMLLPMMFDGIDVAMNESDEGQMWVYHKYVLI